jgi:regulator of sigma D
MSSFFEGVSASMKRLEADVTSHLGALTERLSSLEDKVSAKSQDIDNLLDFACSLEEVVKKIEDKLAVKAT